MLVVWMQFEWRELGYLLSLVVLGAELDKVGEALPTSDLKKIFTLTRYSLSSL
jgi:hypothetical protein